MAMKQLRGLIKPLTKYTMTALSSLCSSGRSKAPPPEPTYAFMNIIVKFDVEGPGWHKIVNKVLAGIKGVVRFKMEGDGTVMIYGTVDPCNLLKRLGKAGARASIKHWQYGQCCSDLYYPTDGGNVYEYGGGDYGYPAVYGHLGRGREYGYGGY